MQNQGITLKTDSLKPKVKIHFDDHNSRLLHSNKPPSSNFTDNPEWTTTVHGSEGDLWQPFEGHLCLYHTELLSGNRSACSGNDIPAGIVTVFTIEANITRLFETLNLFWLGSTVSMYSCNVCVMCD